MRGRIGDGQSGYGNWELSLGEISQEFLIVDVEYIRLDFGFVILPIMVDCSELFYLVPGNYWLWAKIFGELVVF